VGGSFAYAHKAWVILQDFWLAGALAC